MMHSQLSEKIRGDVVRALSDYRLIEEGDRVMVGISGGKDSAVLLLLLDEIRRRAPFAFTLHPVMLDQKQPGFDEKAFCAWFAERGLPITVIGEDTYAIVKEKTEPGKAYCGLCSRLRRGILYNYAHAHGYNKIALGHHRDDLNVTMLLNLFYGGRIASMPPKLLSDDKRNTVIRPLCYVPEESIATLAAEIGFPIIPCNLCGSQDGLKRARLKKLVRELEEEIPNISASLLTAQKNVRPSQLADMTLW